MYPTIRVDREQALSIEPLGTKWKFWYSDGNRRILFKAEERGTGEDWAEKVVSELCARLGIPHVTYDLAELYEDNVFVCPGAVCESCAPAPWSLVLGNQLLLGHDPAYPAEHRGKYKVRAHTVSAVIDVIRSLERPPANWCANLEDGIETALDAFVGYVMLDAWVANQDRHHENWGALRDDRLYLAPTFDHGASLARNLTDEDREERLSTRDKPRRIPAFAMKARSGFYRNPSDSKPLGTFSALEEFAGAAPVALDKWIERLKSIEIDEIVEILDNVPDQRMSRTTREFTLQLLLENQQRLCQTLGRK